MDLLPATGEGGIKARRQVLEPNAWSLRIGVAAQHPHKPRTIWTGRSHADEGRKGFTGAMRETVEIASDRQFLRAHARKADGRGATLSRRGRKGRRDTLTINARIVTVRTTPTACNQGMATTATRNRRR